MNKPKQILCLIIALFICIQYVKPNNGKYNITTEPPIKQKSYTKR